MKTQTKTTQRLTRRTIYPVDIRIKEDAAFTFDRFKYWSEQVGIEVLHKEPILEAIEKGIRLMREHVNGLYHSFHGVIGIHDTGRVFVYLDAPGLTSRPPTYVMNKDVPTEKEINYDKLFDGERF